MTMTYNLHVPSFLSPKFGQAISIEVRNKGEPSFTEKWVVANAFITEGDSATQADIAAHKLMSDIPYMTEAELISAEGEYPIHDEDVWAECNDFALVA